MQIPNPPKRKKKEKIDAVQHMMSWKRVTLGSRAASHFSISRKIYFIFFLISLFVQMQHVILRIWMCNIFFNFFLLHEWSELCCSSIPAGFIYQW